MFSYIFMKILEKRPERYDKGINVLSGGHAKKIREQIVRTYVQPGMEILDIGCGTGLFLIAAAKAGANVAGVDIANGMLEVAKKRITDLGLQDRISLRNAGAAEMGSLFNENSFDLIVSTLVFSELYSEERALVLQHIRKILKPDGRLIIAVEVQPENFFKKIIHSLIRFPLAVLTYLIAQTGTKPYTQVFEEINNAGLTIVKKERSFLDSFIVLSIKKSEDGGFNQATLSNTKKPQDDISLLKSAWDFLGRWFPNPVEPGLRTVGRPDRNSPVLLTSNFHLTVRRVEKALQNENVFLLVAPSNGINVWCASCGGELNTHNIITAIMTSRINERVNHHEIILPQFSAPGVDRQLLKKETGRNARFGPAYSKDIPIFLKNRSTLLEHNCADFSLPFRLEMLLSMNFVVWFFFGIITLLLQPKIFSPLSVIFWTSGLILYAGFPLIPGESGWLKAGILSVFEILMIILFSSFIFHLPVLNHWKMIATICAVNLWIGFDLRGIVAGRPSEAEWLMHKLGMSSFAHIFSENAFNAGKIHLDINKCNNCRMCLTVCPKSVFGIIDKKKVRIQNQPECFACTACVRQCTEKALFIK